MKAVGLHTLSMLDAISALGLMLLPLASDVPSTETLMTGIVPGKVAILLKTLFFVATRNKMDLLVVAHDAWRTDGIDLTEAASTVSLHVPYGHVNVQRMGYS
jgi:hypothetical protein